MKSRQALRWLARPVHLWITVFIYTVLSGLLVQLVLLPHVFPAWHDGFGLIKGVDGLKFHHAALDLAEAIEQQGWSQWVPQPKGQLVSGIAAIFYVLVYPAPWSVLPANAVLNATACLCLYLLLARLTKDTNAAVAAAAPFALFPSNLLWNAQFHNENYAVPGVIFILLGWLMVLQDDPSRTATRVVRAVAACTLIGVGSLLLGLVRHYILNGMTYLSITAALFLLLGRLTRKPGLRSILTSTLLLLAASTTMALMVRALRGEGYYVRPPSTTTPIQNSTGAPVGTRSRFWAPTVWLPGVIDRQLEDIARTRRSLIRSLDHGGTSIDLDVTFRKAMDIIAYVPRALQIAFLSPFPSLWFSESTKAAGSAMRAVSALEMLFVYCALAGLPIFVWKHRAEPSLWLLLLVCTGMLVVYAMSVPNVGALYRFRYPFLMPLVCLGTAGWISRIGSRPSGDGTAGAA